MPGFWLCVDAMPEATMIKVEKLRRPISWRVDAFVRRGLFFQGTSEIMGEGGRKRKNSIRNGKE